MKAFLFAALVGLLHAEVVVKQLTIQEGGTKYTQTVTLDFERNIQILEVPAHNNIVHSKTIFDFNQGAIFESHPERKICYMKDIPEGVVSMDKFAAYLDAKTGPVTASKEKITRRAYKTTSKVTLHQMSSMASEVVAECGGSTVFHVVPASEDEFEVSYSRAPQGLGEAFLGDDECTMQGSCLWQTCQVGSPDSCWWTVNCEANELHCDETLEHNSIIHECAGPTNQDCQVSCKPCFNTQCPGCEEAWEKGCRPGFESQHINECPDNPALGKNCGIAYCMMHADVAGGAFNCPADEPGAGRIQEGHTCLLFCGTDLAYGGIITCNKDGTWEESGLSPGC